MVFATGISKILAWKRETTWGSDPADTGGAQQMRRTQSTLNEERAQILSNELNPSQQLRDARHGFRQATGSINAEIAPGNCSDFLAAILRRDFSAGASSGGQTVIAAASAAPHLTRTTGSFLTDGFKVGDVVTMGGWTEEAAANNHRNYIIAALTATTMALLDIGGTAATVVAKPAGDSVTVAVAGKKTWVPSSGHSNVSYTIEHWHADIGLSERFNGVKPSQVQMAVQPGAMATASFTMLGRGMQKAATPFFTVPAAPGTGGLTAGPNGALLVGGAPVAWLTSLNVTINANAETAPAIGSVYGADLVRGRVAVQGSFQAYLPDPTLRDHFLDESSIQLGMVLAASSAGDADFVNVQFPNVKLFSATKDDGEKKIVQTFNFLALENTAGGAGQPFEATTVSIQDSLAA